MRTALLALAFVSVSAVARADDEPSFVFTNAALYDAAVLPFGSERTVEARPLVVFDWLVHEGRSARLWLGAGLGPWFRFLAQNDTHIGFTALLAFDVAIPISASLSFDVIVRAGGQIDGSAALARPDPVGQFLFGLTWEEAVRSSSRTR